MPDAIGQPLPEDLTRLQVTVTFTTQVWNIGQEKTPEELAREFQSNWALMQDELGEAVSSALDLEVTVEPDTGKGKA
ncbi:hypothetical protein ACFW2V_13820 [Streptomyces sp. NPDC058947]|uniref:hypothetical protein n=1 Tax=Streptomyces sp. NPDC058947 TaxID=3346675 RepID=UPI00368333D2